MNLYPTICNLCGGQVIYTSNANIYGREYGSGRCYLCTRCGAYVGTHSPRPRDAMGILANREMRELKKECHALFDPIWKGKPKANKNGMIYMLGWRAKWIFREKIATLAISIWRTWKRLNGFLQRLKGEICAMINTGRYSLRGRNDYELDKRKNCLAARRSPRHCDER